VALAWNSFATPTTPDAHTFGYKWNSEWVKKDDASSLIVLPEYFRLKTNANKKPVWTPVRAEEVPAETGLAALRFDQRRNRTPKTYETPDAAESSWKKPGPKAGPFQAHVGDGSVVT
jgi:hypothetical protein